MTKSKIIPFWLKFLFKRFENEDERKRTEATYYLEGEELDRKLAELDSQSDKELRLKVLELDKKYDKIDKHAYEKEKATLNEEPYVGCLDSEFDVEEGVNGFFFELDWNDYFVKMLKTAGYTGTDEVEIVQHWFDDICAATAQEGEFMDISDVQKFNTARSAPFVTTREDNDGKTTYS